MRTSPGGGREPRVMWDAVGGGALVGWSGRGTPEKGTWAGMSEIWYNLQRHKRSKILFLKYGINKSIFGLAQNRDLEL